ncbi:MAG: type II toxin-antitoxin system PemK/MazF family toxin [Heliobacteriaceae bacterium]|nr:type II toxin-antitoxin system PemK/MazF family toxin [Heliobacteriaceae bacterium]
MVAKGRSRPKDLKQEGEMPDIFSRMDDVFSAFRKSVNRLRPTKRKRLALEWLETWSNYLAYEHKFAPTSIRRYVRGDVVFANFGFKVGNEFGGCHYAVVIENNNAATNGTVIVVPLKSLKSEAEISGLDWKDVFLGRGIIPWKEDILTIAKVNQLCALSKMRIIHPTSQSEKIINLSGTGLMKKIDKILLRLCTIDFDRTIK